MPEGRLTRLMAGIQQRLSAARETARSNAASAGEFSSPEEDGPASETSDAKFVIENESARGKCAGCGGPLGDDPYLGDEGLLCSRCGSRYRDRRPPVTGWKDESLDPIGTQILQELEAVYPDALNARELAERLQGKGFSADEADKPQVNWKLYRPLNEWLEKDGETPPYWSLRAAEPGEITELVSDATPEHPHKRHPGQSCDGCGDPRGEEVHLGENGEVLCSVCGSSERGLKPPVLEWQDKSLSYLSREVIEALHNLYPTATTIEGLVGRLRRKGFPNRFADAGRVTEKLKGPLFRWTRSGGENPSYWALKPAAGEQDEDGASDSRFTPRDGLRQSEVGSNVAGEESGSGLDSRSSTGGSSDDSHSGRVSGGGSGAEYELCDVCMTEKPSDAILPLRGRSVCEKCFNEMRHRPG